MSSFFQLDKLREEIQRVKDTDDVPMVLVGNKSDLADSRAASVDASEKWENIPYYKCSAKVGVNVSIVFDDLCRQIMQRNAAGLGGRRS
ncbi:Ras family protein [Paraphaeosphaeria sporulosa]